MWCKPAAMLPVILAGCLMCTSEAFGGISSFGKANTDPPPKPVTPAAAPAKPCSRHNECIAVATSSCVRTHFDSQTRCLCGDNSAPINGQCEALTKSLYHSCGANEECNDGLICGTPNATDKAPHLRMLGPKDTICLCDTESGFREKDHTCSDAAILTTSLFAIAVVSCIRKVLAN
ncbi:uncharacterized protein LOC133532509 isoform X2 [Cydia pomonella]|uniref:uncharacterized protein LOC133532509 isoform X2 n=1 Tax=Cydia pomonella TaxID=82600 RepID=UPI002ADD38C9|nr:uncharacterized protein LOC133532509 isoform X2 [Cydia pomonella]XP_061727211.1 uncharacterized protein LOC133532509 isoform X2 [Cydia pomonella]XP_061727212.1 uncharacterized protein LOC133532509 isoform X2 [Cydia pomonella]XP_061727213.1 uncharacterized protein LOC133532509 isoform X2 [Cydia pomonella]XP_061727214.1 uncharacterized protein LOC133532509 isoform X2 [Cydia pomonella]XP_061727215.1 uncharacterized protein LOC133532509 isoform X2 [Cydia pomonella]